MFQYADGEYFQCVWKNDKPNGYGINIDKNMNVYEGNFENGDKSGKGLLKWSNGNTYEGEF